MIRDRDCDVEALSTEDFDDDDLPEMKIFVMEQAKLAKLCKISSFPTRHHDF